MTATKSAYLPQLTWLRGIAALLVIASHTARSTEAPYSAIDTGASLPLLNAIDLGSLAVTLFFALSGATLYFSHRNDSFKYDTFSFIAKRFLRIYPAFLASMAAYLLINPIYISIYGNPKLIWMDEILIPFTSLDIFKHLFLFFDLIGNPFILNGAYWSLPVEFRYYLLFPFALLILKKLDLWGVLIFTAAIVLLRELSIVTPSIPHFFILAPSFFGGMLAAYIVTAKRREALSASPYIIALLFLLGSAVWNFRTFLPDLPIIKQFYNWNNLIAVGIVYFSLRLNPEKCYAPLQMVLGFTGKISYSLYLFHHLFISGAFLACMHLGITGNMKPLFILPVTLLLTFATAWASYKYIEAPAISLSKRLFRKTPETHSISAATKEKTRNR